MKNHRHTWIVFAGPGGLPRGRVVKKLASRLLRRVNRLALKNGGE